MTEIVADLRRLADWIEAHPEHPLQGIGDPLADRALVHLNALQSRTSTQQIDKTDLDILTTVMGKKGLSDNEERAMREIGYEQQAHAATKKAYIYQGCPACGGQYSDMPGHLEHAHGLAYARSDKGAK